MSTDAAVAEPVTQEPIADAPAEPKAKKKPASIRDAVKSASVEVADREAKGITETESAARVLRGEPEYPEEAPEKETKKAPEKAKAAPKAKTEDSKAKAEPEKAKGPERGEDGRFKAKDAGKEPEAKAQPAEKDPEPKTEPKADNPESSKVVSRLSKEAQAEWDNTPEAVRNEVTRAVSELESGFEKHRDRAKKYEAIEQFEPLGARYGMDVPGVLRDYAGMAVEMNKGTEGAEKVFRALAQRHGISFEEIASKAMNVDLEDYVTEANDTIAQLRKRVTELEGIAQKYTQEKTTQSKSLVEDFAKERPRFEELAPTIKWIMQTNGVDKSDPQQALIDAYEMAERLKPAAEPASQDPVQEDAPAQPDLSAQTALAEKSVTGSPAPGSNPATRKPAASARDAVRAAARRTGIA